MYDIKIDNTTNDIIIEDSDIKLTESVSELLKQRLLIIFRTFVGEWLYNTSFGGYDREFFTTKGVTKELADAYFIDIIRNVDEVDEILNFESTFDKTRREYSLNFYIKAVSGDTGTFEINFSPPAVEVAYPETNLTLEGTTCEVVTIESANDFYVLVNIDIPTTIPWD